MCRESGLIRPWLESPGGDQFPEIGGTYARTVVTYVHCVAAFVLAAGGDDLVTDRCVKDMVCREWPALADHWCHLMLAALSQITLVSGRCWQITGVI